MMDDKDASCLQQKASYNAFASYYREYSESKRNYIDAVDKAVISRVKYAKSIFDFGAGDGVRGAKLKGMIGAECLVQGDISEEMLQLCKKVGEAERLIDTSLAHWHRELEHFDMVCALWNVVGLISSEKERTDTLKILKSLLNPGGVLVFDVNNRHNQHYGKMTSFYRRFLDRYIPDHRRGDVHFLWDINGETFPAYGHLFTLIEVKKLLNDVGFSDVEWLSVNYKSGEISQKSDRGQLLFICRH